MPRNSLNRWSMDALKAVMDAGSFSKGVLERLKRRAIVRRIAIAHNLRAGPSRAGYKGSWEAMSRTEAQAKLAVSGSTEESGYQESGRRTATQLQETVGIRADDVILEIGAGVGRVGAVVAPLCREWIGADVSENMLRHLRRRLKRFRNVRTIALNGYDLGPILPETIDLVYATVVFMHLDEWERYGYVAEGMRVLRPGGRMYVDNFNLLSDDGWAVFEQHRQMSPRNRPPHISKSSTPQELETYFRRAGFESIRQKQEGLWIATFGHKPIAF
jgi:ubiquinone/menaquinone biosynthesis C-methylase UbiE